MQTILLLSALTWGSDWGILLMYASVTLTNVSRFKLVSQFYYPWRQHKNFNFGDWGMSLQVLQS